MPTPHLCIHTASSFLNPPGQLSHHSHCPPLSPSPICWFLVSTVKHLVQYLPQILSFQNSIHVSYTFNTNVMEQSRFELLPEALTPALGFFPPGIFNPVPYPIPLPENFAPWFITQPRWCSDVVNITLPSPNLSSTQAKLFSF